MTKLREVRAFESRNSWEQARSSLESARELCSGAAEVILENAMTVEQLGGSAELEWQRATSALENQSKGKVALFLGRFDGAVNARFGIDERDVLVWSSNLQHPIVVDRSTARPVRTLDWLSADPAWLIRDSGLLVTRNQRTIQVFDSVGRLLGALPLPLSRTSTSYQGTIFPEKSRTHLKWIPQGPRGQFLDLTAGRAYDPFYQSEFAPLFRGSPVSSISVSPSGYHWVLWKQPAPGELDTTENANRNVVQVWDALLKTKLAEYPRQASDGIAVSESDVVLYDFERHATMHWNVSSGKSAPLVEDLKHQYSIESALSDGKSVVLIKTPRTAPPGVLGAKVVWTYGVGVRPVEWQDASVLDVTSSSDRALLVRSSGDRDSSTSDVPSLSRVLEVVSLESGKTEAATSTTDSELRQLALSPQHTKIALQAATGTTVLSLLDGRSKRVPYGERHWTMAWNGESEVAFARCGLETLDLVSVDGSRPTRRIPMRKDRSPGGCRPILFVDSGKWVAATIGEKLMRLEVRTGRVEESACGENCQLLATSRSSDSALLGWKRSELGEFGVGQFGVTQRQLLAEVTVKLSSSSGGGPQSVARHILQSADGRWVGIFSGSWIGVWDFNGTGVKSLRSIPSEGPEPLRPLAATDKALYAISANETVLGWEWETTNRVQISDEQARQLRSRLVLQMSPENGGPIVLQRGSKDILGKILLDSDGLPTVVEGVDGHIAFLGDGPRQKPYCIFGEVVAPFRACSDLVLDGPISHRLLDTLAKGEYAEFQFR